jgi:rhodanese-related sulfurtransferase
MKTAVRIFVLGAAALLAGFAVNQFHPEGVHRSLLASAFSGIRWTRISADSAFALFQKKGAVFVDIRSERDFRQDHIPGAASQPFFPFFRKFDRFEQAHPRDGVYVFYCFDPACGEGLPMLRLMRMRGYTRAVWMYGGLSRWIESGRPVEGGD